MRRALIRSLVRKLRLERLLRPLPVKYHIEKVDELEEKCKKLQRAIEDRDRDASGMRLNIAAHVKTIERLKQDVGRDEKIKENRALTQKVASLERINTELNESNRILSSEAAEARGRVQGLLDKLTNAEVAADDAKGYAQRCDEARARAEERLGQAREIGRADAVAEAYKKFELEINLWKQRAIENGWIDPESRNDYQKRQAAKRDEAKQQHPDWTDAQLDQFMDTIGRAIET